jgi:DNA-binding MarR family transcriptional regulator
VQLDSPALVDGLAEVLLELGTHGAPRRGLSRTAAGTLARLQRSGPARLTELAASEGVTQPSMSTLVARLVDQGLVRRGGDPRDARVVVLDLTPAGEQLLAPRRADRTDLLNQALAGLSPADASQLAAALPALARLAGALRPPINPEVNR